MRRYGRVDDNQPEIVKVFRAFGFSVCHLSSLGKGVPDILVGRDGKNYLIEIKDGSKPPSQRKLTPDENEWHLDWKGHVEVIESKEQVAKFFEREFSK